MPVEPPPPGLFRRIEPPPPGLFSSPKPQTAISGFLSGLTQLDSSESGVEPGSIAATGRLAGAGIKDLFVSTAAGIPGLLLGSAALYSDSQKAVAEAVTGKSLELSDAEQALRVPGSYLLGIAAASYDDVLDAQADQAVALSERTGLPLEVTAATTTAEFTAINMLSPGKYAKMLLGIPLKAAGVIYGGSKLIAGGIKAAKRFRGVSEVAERASSVGDMVDPIRSISQAGEVAAQAVEVAAREAPEKIAETLAQRARRAVLQDEQFPALPTAMRDLTVPDELLSAARAESAVHKAQKEALKMFPGLPAGGAATRQTEGIVERAAKSYLESLEAGDVQGAVSKIKAGEKAAAARAAVSSDVAVARFNEDLAAAYREVGMSVEDAAKAGRLETTVLPTDVPDLIITDPVEAARNLGRQYVYRREHSRFVASEREGRLKQVLSSVRHGAQRSVRKAAEISDKALREDMTFWIQRTGNPMVSPTDTVENVLTRIKAHPRGDVALALSESMRPFMDNLYKEMAELNLTVGDKQIKYVENYLHQAWKPERVGGLGGKGGLGGSRGLLDSGLFRGRENLGQARDRVRGRFEELRTLPSYHAGITKAGLEPRTLDAAEILHLVERQYGETMALKKMLADLGELNRMPDGSPAYLRVKSGAFPKGVSDKDYIKADIPYVGRFVEGEGDMMVHKSVFRPVRNIVEGIAKNEGSWIDDISVLNKRANFAFTMFHAYSLAENALLSLGFIKGAKTLGSVAKAGGGIPFAQRLGGPRALDHLTKTNSMRESVIRGLKYNLVVETPRTDLMRNVWERAVGEAAERLSKGGLFARKSGKALEGITWAQKNFDTALWERMHSPLKVAVFDELYDTVLAAKKAGDKGFSFKTGGIAGKLKGKALQGLSDDEIGYRVAAFVNDEFGGQAWETMNGRIMEWFARPKNLQALRRYWISPDWNISSFRANLAMLSLVGGDPVRGILGARHWRNNFLGLAMSFHAMNYMLTAAFEGEGRLAFENDPGKDGMFAGVMPTYVATGMKDENGRRIYIRVAKQIQEVPEFIDGPLDFVGRKMVPWAKAVINSVSREKDPFSFVGKAVQQAREDGIELDNLDYVLMHGADMAAAFSPFGSTVNPLRDPPPLGRGSDLLLPLPQSLGGSRGDLQRRMQKALTEGDTDEQSRIIQSLKDNGYSASEITTIFNTANTLRMKQESN